MVAMCGGELLGLSLFGTITASAVLFGLTTIWYSRKKKNEIIYPNS